MFSEEVTFPKTSIEKPKIQVKTLFLQSTNTIVPVKREKFRNCKSKKKKVELESAGAKRSKKHCECLQLTNTGYTYDGDGMKHSSCVTLSTTTHTAYDNCNHDINKFDKDNKISAAITTTTNTSVIDATTYPITTIPVSSTVSTVTNSIYSEQKLSNVVLTDDASAAVTHNDNNTNNTEARKMTVTRKRKKRKPECQHKFNRKDFESLLKQIGSNISNYTDLNELEFAEGCLIYLATNLSDFSNLEWDDLLEYDILNNVWNEKIVYILGRYASTLQPLDSILSKNRKMKQSLGWLTKIRTDISTNSHSETGKQLATTAKEKNPGKSKVDDYSSQCTTRILVTQPNLPIQMLTELSQCIKIKAKKKT